MKNTLAPALILGSGFHHYVLGSDPFNQHSPLFDWNDLVSKTAEAMELAAPSSSLPPIHRWDSLLIEATQKGFYDPIKKQRHLPRSAATYLIETCARRCVANILKQASQQYPTSARSQYPYYAGWGAIISLNFDAAWATERITKQAQITQAKKSLLKGTASGQELHRLTNHLLINGVNDGAYRRVWFPNGSINSPETIRLGLHDYGASAYSTMQAFSKLKQWEREVGIDNLAPETQIQQCAAMLRTHSEGAPALEPSDNAFKALSWVADFLYRPLVFAGIGLSEQEQGMWWLLAQRARNQAKNSKPSPAYILVNNRDKRAGFWRSKPFGVQPVFCSEWDAGWEELKKVL